MKFSLIASIFLTACTSQFRAVDVATYRDLDKCWSSGDGYFEAIVVLTPVPSGYSPIFFSKKCVLEDNGKSGINAILDDNLDALPISGDDGSLMSLGKIDRKIVSNTVDHKAYPTKDSKVYEFRGKLRARVFEGRSYYVIENADRFENIGTFGETKGKIWP